MNTDLLTTLKLQFFAESDTDVTQSDVPETAPNGDTPADTKVESSDTQVETPKTYTQDEINDIIAKRLERERKKYEGFAELKAKATEYETKLEEQRLAELSEKERAEELAKKFETELTELKSQLEAKENAIREQAIKNEFIKVATSANIIDIDAAIALSDLTAVSIDENGAVVGVDNVITTLVEHKPYLVAKKQAQPIGQATNAGTSQYVDKSADQLLAEAADKARRTGTLADKVAYAQLKKQLGK